MWDTGIGIAEASLPRIFDEFYQVQSNRPLQAHHRKGLGLGLAIVKRLARPDGSADRRALAARPRHGVLARAAAGQGAAQHRAGRGRRKAPLGLTLDGRLIVVVEDEAAVREGLVVLLQAWGARGGGLRHRGGGARLGGRAGGRAPTRPAAGRLPPAAGHTGIDALAACARAGPAQRLPAIVITGSSLGGHEDEADAHDFHLLIKPVLPNKLRAMIAFKLGLRTQETRA